MWRRSFNRLQLAGLQKVEESLPAGVDISKQIDAENLFLHSRMMEKEQMIANQEQEIALLRNKLAQAELQAAEADDAEEAKKQLKPSGYSKHFEKTLNQIKSEGRYRVFTEIQRHANQYPVATWFKPNGEKSDVVVWCSNDYLGMGEQKEVVKAMHDAIDTYGAGAGGTRNISGNTKAHCELEYVLADWHSKDSALCFTSGYVANEATLATLPQILPNCVYISDEENHASMIRGIKASRAAKRVWRHNDIPHLEELLRDIRLNSPKASIVIAFESVYSMSGTIAPIRDIVRLAKQYNAFTFCDEVHAVGLYGPKGDGVAALEKLSDHVDIIQGTLGKAVGCAGGYIAASNHIIDALRSLAAGFIFTTSIPPAVAAAAATSVTQLSTEDGVERRAKFWHNVEFAKKVFSEAGLPVLQGESHIVPILICDSVMAKQASDILLKKYSIYVQPINYPTVPRGRERLRITPSPVHTEKMILELRDALVEIFDDIGLPRRNPAAAGTDHAAALEKAVSMGRDVGAPIRCPHLMQTLEKRVRTNAELEPADPDVPIPAASSFDCPEFSKGNCPGQDGGDVSKCPFHQARAAAAVDEAVDASRAPPTPTGDISKCPFHQAKLAKEAAEKDAEKDAAAAGCPFHQAKAKEAAEAEAKAQQVEAAKAGGCPFHAKLA
eukprot:TRINITY_DN12933_c0_g1_i1.p2 TRINITY_DN12933_c0_g1~~TRINITY_DN12933_c0_g1_i1.p2  ORF type:complete len:667 (+),score=304.35 TRINITY_DN12933_c0_g1_i1:103-2103(+)